MKLARVLPAFAQVAALVTVALGAPARAAGPVERVVLSSGAAAQPVINEPRVDRATARGARTHAYNLGTATASDGTRRGIGLAVAGIEWSPRIANWSGSGARLRGFDRKRFNIAQGGVVTVIGRHVVRTRFTLSRRHVQVELRMAF